MDGYTPCSRGYPSLFCCQSSETCMSLAGHTTALCCPGGSKCEVLTPISCKITLQNATADPFAVIVTTELDKPLPRCAGQCCPFGFTCGPGDPKLASFCIRNEDQSKFSALDSSSSRVPPLPGVFLMPSTTASTASTATPKSSSSSSESDSKPTATTSPTPAVPETAAPANGTAAAAAPQPDAPSSQTVGIAVGSSLGAFAMVGGLLAAAYLKRDKLSSIASRSRSLDRLNRRHRKYAAPFWASNNNGGGGGSYHSRRFHFGWPGRRLRSPSPPPYHPYQDQEPLHLSLDQCKRIPRRKTVPINPALVPKSAPAMAFEPVELPASPVPWARFAGGGGGRPPTRGSESFLPKKGASGSETFQPTVVPRTDSNDRMMSFRTHERKMSFSRPFQQQQQPRYQPQPTLPAAVWPRPLRVDRSGSNPAHF